MSCRLPWMESICLRSDELRRSCWKLWRFFALEDGAEVFTSKGVVVHARIVQLRDVVMFEADGSIHFGQVNFHVRIGKLCMTCLTAWHVVRQSSHCVVCHVGSQPVLVHSSVLLEPCVFRRASVGQNSTVLLPPRYRVAGYSSST